MSIEQRVRARVDTLIARAAYLSAQRPQVAEHVGRDILDECAGWVASAENILQIVFPNVSSPYRMMAIQASGEYASHRVGKLSGVLRAMLVDIDAGVIATVADAARGEIFDDFMDQADYCLKANKVSQAGVLAGVVFEDTVRKLCRKLQIGVVGAKVDVLISDLEKAQVLTPVKAKRARVAADVRTRATHADWEKFEKADVEDTIKIGRELIELL